MSSFFRSKLARELAAALRQPRGGRLPCPRRECDEREQIREDPEYYTDRHHKQMKLAESAVVPAAREAHLKMAWLYRAKAAEALRLAMHRNRDALHLSLMDLPSERNPDLDSILEVEHETVRGFYVERS